MTTHEEERPADTGLVKVTKVTVDQWGRFVVAGLDPVLGAVRLVAADSEVDR